MKRIRATFENFAVEFCIGQAQSHNTINQLAYEILKEEGADCLLSEVEWDFVVSPPVRLMPELSS